MTEKTPYPPWQPPPVPLPVEMSEDHLANKFAESICKMWRYCHVLRRWFHLDGIGWQEDTTREMDHLVVAFCRHAIYWREAEGLTSNEKRWIATKRTAGNVRDLAKCDRRIAATPEQLGYETPRPGMCGTRWTGARLNP